MNHDARLDAAGVLHVRGTAYANDVKMFNRNTLADAANRIDQNICAPMCFVIDELVDMTDQYHPVPITAVTEGGDEDEILFLGNRIPVKSLWDEMTTLTSIRRVILISKLTSFHCRYHRRLCCYWHHR